MKRFISFTLAVLICAVISSAYADSIIWNCPNNDGYWLTTPYCPYCGTARPTKPAKVLEVGQIIKFGAYEQDDDLDNGVEPIEWIVLEVEDNKAFLISKYIIESQCYNQTAGDIVWADCSLRKWLNNDFIKTAFSMSERAAILNTDVSNSGNQQNRLWKQNGGANTVDKVYLLSYTEAWGYFTSDAERAAKMTPYISHESNIANRNWRTMHWLTRSPGHQQDYVIEVFEDGECYTTRPDAHRGVRPVIWIDYVKADYAE